MKESTTIAFTGDIGFDKYMDKKWEDDALLAPGILEFLTSADHVVANVEGPLVDNTATLMQAAEMRLMHTINPAAERVLKDIHADIWNLCNNHIMDAGQDPSGGREVWCEDHRCWHEYDGCSETINS